VTWAIDEKGYSQRRACALIGMPPKTYRYVSSASTCSEDCRGHARSSKRRGSITMPAGPIPASAGSPRTSLQPGPSRTTTRTDSGQE
jgi:hypothetical protein